jgi:hypothetical protein
VEDEVLTEREDEEVRDSPIDIHNMVDLCEKSTCLIITKRTVKGKQVKVACGYLADECPRRSHAEQRQNSPSSRADGLWYEVVPSRCKTVTDGVLDGDVLTAEGYADAQAREEADIQALAASLYPDTDEEATDSDATDRERVHFADQPANQARRKPCNG